MSASSEKTSTTADGRGFLPIAIDTLAPTSSLGFDLFVRPVREGSVVMFRERCFPLEREDLDRLAASGLATLYIPITSHESYCRYLNKKVTQDEHVPPEQRYQVLQAANRAVFQAVFRSGNVTQVVEFSRRLGEQITDLVCNQGLVLGNLLPLMTHDYYTYTHVTNVCTYCLALASGLGISEQSELLDIASGALLHDLGKRQIPPGVLNHPGRLSKEQWEMVRRHPADGFHDLCHREDLNWDQLMMAYQHHERPDGKGYPVGSVGPEIHSWARICKVADVFDALSSDRPYRKAMPIVELLQFLDERSGTEFDEEITRCLTGILEDKN